MSVSITMPLYNFPPVPPTIYRGRFDGHSIAMVTENFETVTFIYHKEHKVTVQNMDDCHDFGLLTSAPHLESYLKLLFMCKGPLALSFRPFSEFGNGKNSWMMNFPFEYIR